MITDLQWERFVIARKRFSELSNEKAAATTTKSKKRLDKKIRGQGLKQQTFGGTQTRYNPTLQPGMWINPATGKTNTEWHHALPYNRALPYFKLVKTREDLDKLYKAFTSSGIATGNEVTNMFDLLIDLHDSNNPNSIHAVERALGMDATDYYVPKGASLDEALTTIPKLASDVTESKNRIRKLQFEGNLIGESGSVISEGILKQADNTLTKQVEQTASKALSDEYHSRINQTRQQSLNANAEGKTSTPESMLIKHGDEIYIIPHNTSLSIKDSISDNNTEWPELTPDQQRQAGAHLSESEDWKGGSKHKEKGQGFNLDSKVGGVRTTDQLLNFGTSVATGDVVGATITGATLATTEALKNPTVQKKVASQVAELVAKRGAKTAAKLVPGLDVLISGKETWDYLSQGRLDQAAIAGLSGAIGWIPVIGDGASAALDLTNTGIDIARLQTPNRSKKKKPTTDVRTRSSLSALSNVNTKW